MGTLSDLVNSSKSYFPGADVGREVWRQIFGTTKEDAQQPVSRPNPRTAPGGGSWGRSMVSTEAAFKRLVEAMRSMAPGGWSDNRWEQTRHFTGIQYVCFPAGTRVRMADGTYKPIEKVSLRDEVLTAEGNTHRVTHCFVHRHDGELVTVRLWGHRHLRLTPEHEVFTKRGYISAKDLTTDDWVAIPRYSPNRVSVLQTAEHVVGETCIKQNAVVHATGGTPWTQCRTVPDLIDLTYEFGRLIGLYLAEAHTTKKGEITWSFSADKESDTLVPELVGTLEKFGFSPCVSRPKYNQSVVQVTVCGKLWVRLFHSLCGKGAGEKRLHADLLSGPRDFLAGVLRGWLDGDGFSKDGGKTWAGATVSHDLALNMYDIGNILGLRPVIWRQKPRRGSIFGRKAKVYRPVWKVFFCSSSDNYRVIMDDTHVWRKVESLGWEKFSGDVFNIEVAVDNSYVAEGIGVHNCIHRSGEQLADSEFQVFYEDPDAPDGKREVSINDPPQGDRQVRPYDLVELLKKPNRDDGFGDIMYNWNLQLDLTGMALTWMVPNALGVPYELYSIPTAIAIPQPAVNPDYPDGYYRIQPVYPYGPFSSFPTPASAVGAAIPAQWMLRFKYPHPLLRYDGYSPLSALRLHIDEVEAIDRSRWYKMKRSSNPDAVLNMDEMEGGQPLPEPEIERVRAMFEEFQGPENHGKLLVSAPGCRLEPWGANPADMEYQAGWEQLVSFAMAGFGITKPAAGMIEDSSYATLFATLKQLHLLTLQPQCNRIARQLTRHLAPFFGDNLIIEIRCKRIDDHDLKLGKLNMAISAKAIKKNELRKELELPLTEDPWGEDMAGDPTPFEQEQAAQQQQAMMAPPGGAPGQEMPVEGGEPGMEEAPQPDAEGGTGDPLADMMAILQGGQGPAPDEEEMAAGQPTPGRLSEGALGPRKSLNGHHPRSFYDQVREAISNGH